MCLLTINMEFRLLPGQIRILLPLLACEALPGIPDCADDMRRGEMTTSDLMVAGTMVDTVRYETRFGGELSIYSNLPRTLIGRRYQILILSPVAQSLHSRSASHRHTIPVISSSPT